MKKALLLRRTSGWLLAINAAAVLTMAIFMTGCATPEEHSYNPDFNADLATEPKYYIHDENDQHFLITVHQGVVSTKSDRILDVHTAATDVAKRECARLNWDKWHMDYIQEKNDGWMHVVVVDVTRDTKTGQ